jgi:Protein of unknown function (DUF1501)
MLGHLGWRSVRKRLQLFCDSARQSFPSDLFDSPWTGEFGRTPYPQGGDGRDHNNKAFTLWMAGGRVKPGFDYGSSGDYGHKATENPGSIHDLNATMLALLGLDHTRLTFNYAGRDFRLTDVHGNVVKDIVA